MPYCVQHFIHGMRVAYSGTIHSSHNDGDIKISSKIPHCFYNRILDISLGNILALIQPPNALHHHTNILISNHDSSIISYSNKFYLLREFEFLVVSIVYCLGNGDKLSTHLKMGIHNTQTPPLASYNVLVRHSCGSKIILKSSIEYKDLIHFLIPKFPMINRSGST